MEPLVSPCFRSAPFFEPRQPLELEPFSITPCEAFTVDDLLDFSNNDISSPSRDDCASFLRFSAENSSASTTPDILDVVSSERCSSRAPLSVFEAVPPSAEPLYTPPDELAELDWLSTFVEEDSYTADKSLAPFVHSNFNDCKTAGVRNVRYSFQNESPVSVLEEGNALWTRSRSILGSTTVVKARSRSKRSRTGGRVWSLNMLTLLPSDRNSASEKPAYEDLSEDSQSSSLEYEAGDLFRPKKRSNKGTHSKRSSLDNSQPRRCMHCQVQRTPQWRAGPSGPKTLCNACGVRYKSGRLVPEYRPAASPSFMSEIHSNSHKKILEMRLYKDEELDDGELSPRLDPEIFNATSDLSEELEDPCSSQESMTSNHRGIET